MSTKNITIQGITHTPETISVTGCDDAITAYITPVGDDPKTGLWTWHVGFVNNLEPTKTWSPGPLPRRCIVEMTEGGRYHLCLETIEGRHYNLVRDDFRMVVQDAIEELL